MIAYEGLSETSQDAVDIYRRLEVEFLWIDSLCIIRTLVRPGQKSQSRWAFNIKTRASPQ